MKTSRWGKSVYLCVLLCLMCFLVAGCAPKEKPQDNVMSLCKGILYQDAETLAKYEVDGDKLHKQLIRAFNSNFNAASEGMFSKEQSTRIAEAYLNALKRVDISVEPKSQDGEKAEVEVTVSRFNIEKAFDEQTLVEKLKTRLPANPSEKMITDTITDILVEIMDGLQADGTQKFTVKCNYDKKNKMWMPEDMDQFTDQLESAVLGI